jgi:hypothetical protein
MEEIVGQGNYRYRVHWDWQRAPEHVEVHACAVAVDAEDRVYCFNRNKDHPIVIFHPAGSFAGSWGAGSSRMRWLTAPDVSASSCAACFIFPARATATKVCNSAKRLIMTRV